MKTNDAHRVPPEILVVDDTVASLDLLCDLLTEAGYVVRPAQDGRMALRSAQAKPPELILLDVRMPGMDGYELCQRLKAEPATRDIPIIFLSALRDTGDKVRGFSLGAVDYIAKPFQPEEVLARVPCTLELWPGALADRRSLHRGAIRSQAQLTNRRVARSDLPQPCGKNGAGTAATSLNTAITVFNRKNPLLRPKIPS